MALFQKLYTVKAEQFIPISMDEAWEFFSNPENLQKITPSKMGFKITHKSGDTMYPGMLITYIVSPLLGIPMRWCTEITQVKEHEYFIDEQRFGPYSMWHHQHHFEEVKGGVIARDLVNYGVPLGFIGQIANALSIRSQVKEIFEYRITAVEKLWPVGLDDPKPSVVML